VVCGLERRRRQKKASIRNAARSGGAAKPNAEALEKRGKNESASGNVASVLAPYIARWQQPQQRSLGRNYLWAARALVKVAGRCAVKNLAPIDAMSAVETWDQLAQSTRYARGSALGYVLRLLEKAHGAPEGLSKTIPRVGKQSPRNVTATRDERAALIDGASPNLRLVLLLCSDLAMRSGTAITIGPQNYDPDTGLITFRTKYGRSLTLPASTRLRAMLAEHQGPTSQSYYSWFSRRDGKSDTIWRREFKALRRTRHRTQADTARPPPNDSRLGL
jgi:hypothetical protein